MHPAVRQVLLSAGGVLDPTSLLTTSNGFLFDFTTGATGAGISSVTSAAPSTLQATQGSASLRPTHVDADPDYASFDGVDDLLQSTLTPGSDTILGLVYRPTAAGGVTMGTADAGPANRCYIGCNASGQPFGTWGATSFTGPTSILNQTVVQLFRVIGGGAMCETWLNYQKIASGPATGSPSSNSFGLGGIGTLGGGPSGCRVHVAYAVKAAISNRLVVPLMRGLARRAASAL